MKSFSANESGEGGAACDGEDARGEDRRPQPPRQRREHRQEQPEDDDGVIEGDLQREGAFPRFRG